MAWSAPVLQESSSAMLTGSLSLPRMNACPVCQARAISSARAVQVGTVLMAFAASFRACCMALWSSPAAAMADSAVCAAASMSFQSSV